jgi:tetratricopeptide (TPR) repeat protein
LLVVAAGLLAYHNSFTGPFIFDDLHWIPENPTIRHLWPIWDVLSPPSSTLINGRPVVNFTLAVNYALGGYNVWGYHALNLAVHILAGLTLFGIVRRTLRQPRLRERFGAVADELALAVAVIWTVHPLQTESVTYVIQRAESIMGLFYLLTLYGFIRGAASPRPRLWYGLCVAACALGMASKEVMVSAPLMVMLYDRAFVSGSFREAWRRRRPLYLGLSATWILQGFIVVSAGTFANASIMAQHEWGVTRWQYLLTEAGVILHYLRLAAWPYPLCFDYYGWPIAGTGLSTLLPTLVVAILLGATVWMCITNSAWGFGGAWFFLILAPSSSIIPLDSPAYEHRMYLSLAAVIVLGVMGIHAWIGRRTVAVAVVLAVALGVLTWRRNQDYRSDVAIWRDTVAKCPNNPRAHNNLGLALAQVGRLPEAIVQCEQALRIKPDDAEAHCNLGYILLKEGKISGAIGHSEQALRMKPYFAEAHDNLGLALAQAGKTEDAIAHYEQALRIKPYFAEADCNLGAALGQAGRMREAIAHLQQALRIKPDFAEAHGNLGTVFLREGKLSDAIAQFEQALRIKPDYYDAHNNLGDALVRLGKLPEAIVQYQQALQSNPGNADARSKLGAVLIATGHAQDARSQLEEALRINPVLIEAQNNLAWVLAILPPAEGGDPARAVALAQRACERSGNRAPGYLDTLAAAYAATGRFDDAIATAEKAIELARADGQAGLGKEIEARLGLYRSGRAYRRPVDEAERHSP